MAEISKHLLSASSTDELVEKLRRARSWAWSVHDNRIPGVARDLAWALVALARDHDLETRSPYHAPLTLEPEILERAIDLARNIARIIIKADALQPHLVLDREAFQ